ncbi:type VI secretion system-associated protein VasI [Pseudomonas sp. Teo4]|uniref:type VI secretion system-associated protein VasI n=1 Tax=Pseudomonas sp. Teo4 TaxID=3064528 RepID=UPI002ABC1395|nr:type VI secretion system-associated protein VasI [Pseudomonas sp. Teo4]MDZ3992495.1 hypothetical protein [Pseudomonas sp. Teo4]
MVRKGTFVLGLALFSVLERGWANPASDCTRIVSNLERLACFDKAAGTPSRVHATSRKWSNPELGVVDLAPVMADEVVRTPDDFTFHIHTQADGPPGQRRLSISAPAIVAAEPRPWLVISCVQNISRLQLLMGQPVVGNRVQVQLLTEKGATNNLPWQVMDNGQVLDAGRGLAAIEQIKVLKGAHRIRVVSAHPALSGLSFDAQGLDPLIEQARMACHW